MKKITPVVHSTIKQRVRRVVLKEVDRIDKAIRAALIEKGILK